MQVFVAINKDEMKLNAGVNGKNYLTKKYVIKSLFRIPAVVTMNLINYMT